MVASRPDRGFHFARTWSGRRSREVNARHLQRHPIRSRTQNNNTPKKGGREKEKHSHARKNNQHEKPRAMLQSNSQSKKESFFIRLPALDGCGRD